MSLQLQIEQEIQREAKIDKRIDSIVKRILKYSENRKYRIVTRRKDADAVIVFIRSDLSKYNIVLNEENNEHLNNHEHDARITMIFLKNKKPHDSKKATLGDIINVQPAKKFYS